MNTELETMMESPKTFAGLEAEDMSVNGVDGSLPSMDILQNTVEVDKERNRLEMARARSRVIAVPQGEGNDAGAGVGDEYERWMNVNSAGSKLEVDAYRAYERLSPWNGVPLGMVDIDQAASVKADRDMLARYVGDCETSNETPFYATNEWKNRDLDGGSKREWEKRAKFFEESFDGTMGEGKAMMDGYFGEEDYGAWPDNVKNELRAHQLVVDYLRFRGVPSAELADGGISYIRQMSLGMDGVEQGFEATGVYNALSKEMREGTEALKVKNEVAAKVYKLAAEGKNFGDSVNAAVEGYDRTKYGNITSGLRLAHSKGAVIGKRLAGKLPVLKEGIKQFAAFEDGVSPVDLFDDRSVVNQAAFFLSTMEPEEKRVAMEILREDAETAGFLGRMRKGLNRGVSVEIAGVADFVNASLAGAKRLRGHDRYADTSDEAQRAMTEFRNFVLDDVRQLKDEKRFGFWGNGALSVAESVGMMATAATGPVGASLLAASFSGRNYANERVENPYGSRGGQFVASTLSGGAEAGTEFVGMGILKRVVGVGAAGRFASVVSEKSAALAQKAVSKLPTRLLKSSVKAAAGGALITGSEFTQEKIQDAADPLAQAAVAGMMDYHSGFDWQKFVDDFTDAGNNKEILGACVIFGMIGAGGKLSVSAARDVAMMGNERLLKNKFDFTPEMLSEIREAPSEKAGELIQAGTEKFMKEKYGVTQAAAVKGKTASVDGEVVVDSGAAQGADGVAAVVDAEKSQVRAGMDPDGGVVEQSVDDRTVALKEWIDKRNDDLAALGMAVIKPGRDAGVWVMEDAEGNAHEFDSREEAMEAAVVDFNAQEELRLEADKLGIINIMDVGFRGEDGRVVLGEDGKPKGLQNSTVDAMAEHLDGDAQMGKNARFDFSDRGKKMTVNDIMKRSKGISSTMRARLAIDAEMEGLEGGMSQGARRVMGQNVIITLNNGSAGSIQKLFEGADGMDVAEERTEGLAGELMATGEVTLEEFESSLMAVSKATGDKYLVHIGDEISQRELAVKEGMARVVRAYILGKVSDASIPAVMRRWVRRLVMWLGDKVHVVQMVQRARNLLDADARGELDRKFMGLVADMAGLNEEARAARAQADSEAAIMAEVMGGYDELGDWAKGKLMFPKEAREAGDDLAGELERVYDGLTSEKASKAKMVDGKWVESKSKRVTAKANKYFVKGGMSPADLFELAQEAGFEFENTGDMLSALYDSVAHGIKHYNMSAGDVGQSWSLGASNGGDVLDSLEQLADGKLAVEIANEQYGIITYHWGKAGKKGSGLMHILERRMHEGHTLDEAAEIAVRVGMAAQSGEKVASRMNTIQLDKDGIRAIVAFTDAGNPIITGYKIKAVETVAALHSQQSYSLPDLSRNQEVGAALKRAIANIREEVKSENNQVSFSLAPNGEKSNLTPTQWRAVRTPAFKEWFGDWENDPVNASRVLDENGEPMVVYHGTSDKFSRFDISEVREREGSFFFAQNKREAVDYAGIGHVMALFINLRNPINYDTFDFPEVLQNKRGQVAYLKEQGYDGWMSEMDEGYGEVSAFYPNQIKSATDNRGTFDADNEDISFSIAPAEAAEWGGRLDEYVAGKLDRSRNLRVCSTPPVLQMLGAGDLALEIAPSVIDKCVGGKHGLSYDDLKAVVGEIYDPIAVFESASVGDSMVVLTELKEGGKNVIVAVHLGKKREISLVNVISSLYGKDNQSALLRLPLIYINNKKAVSWGRSQRLQLPRDFTKKGSDKNIKNPEDVVKWKNVQDGKSFSLGPVEDGRSTPLNDGTVWAALSNAMEQGARKKVEILKAAQDRLKAELAAAGMNEDGTLKFADWKKDARLKPRIDSFIIAVRGWFDKQGLAIPQKVVRLIASVEKGETSGDVKKLVRALKAGYEMDEFIEERLKKGGFDADGGTKGLLKDMGKEFTRETALRLLGVMDAVIEVLPKISRDRLWTGDVSRVKNQILTAKTIKGQQSGLCRLIRMVNWAVEGSLKVQMLDEIDRLLKWSEEREGENRVKRGKLMVDVQKEIRQIRAVLMLDEKEVQARMNEVETELGEIGDVSSPRYTELLLRMNRLDVYGNLRKRTEKGRLEEGSARFERAVEDLRSLYGRGRWVNKFMVTHHREQREVLVASAAAAIGRPDALDATESTDSRTAHGKFKGFLRNWLSYENVLEDIFGEVDFVNDLVEKDRAARLALNNARHGRNLAYYDRAARIFGVRVTDKDGNDKRGVMGGVDSSVVRKVNRAVAELSVPRPWGIMKRRTGEWNDEVVNVDDAAALMGGEVVEDNQPEWWHNDVARNAFQKAFDGWSEHFGERESFEFSWLKENDEMIELNLSDMEALYVLQLAGMEQYEDNLRADGFNEKVLEEMREKISDKALALGEFFSEEYEAGYEPMNEVYQRLFYTTLPKVKNYAPGNFKVSGKMDAVDPTDAQGSGWLSMGAIKCRKPHRAQIDIKSAAHVYWQHTMQTDHWLHYAEYVREIKGVFKDASIKSKISALYGASTYEALNDWVEMIENEGPKSKESAKWYVQLSNRVLGARAQGGLTFNKNTLVRQLPAAFASWGDMDMKSVVSGLYGTVTNWDSLSVVWNDDALQQRLYGGMSPEIQAGLKASDMTMSRLGELIKAGMVPIQFFDAAFTALSGAVAYNAAHQSHMKGVGSNMLKENERLVREEAHELGLAAMDKAVRKTAQPMDVEQKSLAELQAKGIMRHLFLFRSDPRKQFALTYMAISKLSKGEIGFGTAAWRGFNSWIMYGVLNQLTTDIVLAIGGSFDDEDDDFFSSIDDYVLSGCLGALSCFCGVSEAVEFAIRKYFGKKTTKFDNSVEGSVDVLARSYKKIAEGESFTVAEMTKVGSAIGRSVNNLGILALIGKPEYGAAMAAGGRVTKDAVNMVNHWGSREERAEKALVQATMKGVVKDKDDHKEIDAVRDKISAGITGKTVGERKREYAKLKLKGGDVTAVENRVAKARLSETAYMLRGLNKEQRKGVLKRLKESEMKPEKYQKLEKELKEFGVK